MANLDLLISTLLTDLDSADTPQQVYAQVADTVTLAQLVTAIQAYQSVLDNVTDALLSNSKVTITIPIVSGLKSTPGPNPIIKGAIFNGLLVGFTNRSYGQTTPAWAQAKIVGGKVAVTDTQVVSYINTWSTAPITNLGKLLSNHWEQVQRFRRVKLNDRSVEREYNSISEEAVP